MSTLNIPIAFSAGVVSFFAPCVLPLLPVYVGYVTGVSVDELKKNGLAPYWKKVFSTSLFFILGFSLVFVSLGAFSAGIGVTLRRHSLLIQRLGGLIILILGLEYYGVLKLSFLFSSRQFKLPKWTESFSGTRAFLVGLIFATTWSPCVGAVLGSILTLAATTGMITKGATLLLAYSLGISVPFLFVSLTLASAPRYLKTIIKKVDLITKVSGILLVVLGLLLLTNTYKYINFYILDVIHNLSL